MGYYRWLVKALQIAMTSWLASVLQGTMEGLCPENPRELGVLGEPGGRLEGEGVGGGVEATSGLSTCPNQTQSQNQACQNAFREIQPEATRSSGSARETGLCS